MAPDRIRDYPVILDTNAFFLPFQFKINLDSELKRLLGSYRYIVPELVVKELNGLHEGGERYSTEALSLLRHLDPEIVPGKGRPDSVVVQTAVEAGGAVLSLDAEVRRKAFSAGVPVIFMRKEGFLLIERP